MAGKDDLTKLLGTEQPKPTIRRGQGVRLSTDEPAVAELRTAAETQEREAAQSQISETAASQERTTAKAQEVAKPKRVNRGYMLREDLIKACKRIALEEDRNLYEVMEEALEQYLAARREPQGS